jgi:hypothetical protein
MQPLLFITNIIVLLVFGQEEIGRSLGWSITPLSWLALGFASQVGKLNRVVGASVTLLDFPVARNGVVFLSYAVPGRTAGFGVDKP